MLALQHAPERLAVNSDPGSQHPRQAKLSRLLRHTKTEDNKVKSERGHDEMWGE